MNYAISSGVENVASISTLSGVLASGVYAVRFDFGAQENSWVGYSELEVVGTPTLGNNALPATTALTVNSTLDLNGGSQQAASLTGSGNIINSYAGTNATLTLAPASGSTTFGGIIQNNGGTGGTVRLTLNSSGSGTQILTGLNTYTGGTTVTQGTLSLTGSLAGGGGRFETPIKCDKSTQYRSEFDSVPKSMALRWRESVASNVSFST